MSQEQAVKQAAVDIWMSIRRFGKPDQVNFVGFIRL